MCGVTRLRSFTPLAFHMVAEDLAEWRDPETPVLHADEERLLDERLADLVVVDDQRDERRVDWDRPLPTALRLPHSQQPPREIDVIPVEAEQLAAAKTRVGEKREQQPVPLRLRVEVRGTSSRPMEARSRSSSPIVKTSGSASRFFGVRSGSAGSRSSRSSSTRKRKKSFIDPPLGSLPAPASRALAYSGLQACYRKTPQMRGFPIVATGASIWRSPRPSVRAPEEDDEDGSDCPGDHEHPALSDRVFAGEHLRDVPA